MGFGKKINSKNGMSLDLDKTYHKIIKPTAEKCGYKCVRSDEIESSSIIDKNMYMLLLCAELVIADVSTYNPNAIYELGIRHALRPFSTIIIKEDSMENIPFDFNHCPIHMYDHSGNDINQNEVNRFKGVLEGVIKNTQIETEENKKIDSPFYEYLRDIPHMSVPPEYNNFIDRLIKEGNTVWYNIQKAQEAMQKKDFKLAENLWKKVTDAKKEEIYYLQQYALCIYKSETPNKREALDRALTIINSFLDPSNTKDVETLGITGAVYKNLHDETNDPFYLQKALEFYQRGYNENYDYYNGENLALCNLKLSALTTDNEERIYYNIQAKKVAATIIDKTDVAEERDDIEWVYATLSRCYWLIGNDDKAKEFEAKFLELDPDDWKKDTFYKNKKWFKQAQGELNGH